MDNKDEEKIEKEYYKSLGKVALFLFSIPIIVVIIIVALIGYQFIGKNSVSLDSITMEEKQELISLLNLQIEENDIVFKKITTPKVYKDISYVLYFTVDNTKKNDIENSYAELLDTTYNSKSEKDNKINYECHVNNTTGTNGNGIKTLDDIINKYSKK